MIDIHTHILPGIDDGPATLDEAIEICHDALNDGITTLVATPHCFNGRYDNPRISVLEAVSDLNKALETKDIALKVLPGAEVVLSSELPSLIESKAVTTINDAGRFLLVELPPFFNHVQAEQMLFNIRLKGITPILAHPERNESAMSGDFMKNCVSQGALVQVTSGSLLGLYGSAIKKSALSLLKRRMLHFISSDVHSHRINRPFISEAARLIEKAAGAETARNIVHRWPEMVISNTMPDVPQPEDRKPGMLSRFLGLDG